jgi:pimeloyl-ACP methyl ester carboxylesterase
MPRERVALREQWTLVNGLPLFYRVATDEANPGSMPIVFLHGFGISGRYMVPTAELLANDHPVYVPDLPGYGRSHKPKGTLSITELAGALEAFLNAVRIERVILLGNSMGCLVALEFAHAHPHRIDRAILVSPAGGPNNQPLSRGLYQLARDATREPLGLVPVAVPDYVGFGPIHSLQLFHAMTLFPTVERALSLDLPMLLVVGSRDPLVSIERLRLLGSMKHNITMVVQEGAAHAINFSHPQELCQEITSWLEGRRTQSAAGSLEDAPDEVTAPLDGPAAAETPDRGNGVSQMARRMTGE